MFDLFTFNLLAFAAAGAMCLGVLGAMSAGVLIAVSGDGLTFTRNELRVAACIAGAGSVATFVIGSIAALLSIGVA